ncbi:uncharacterized protein CEXT_516711 [Caerostris extrusa]|uniref:Uncharacterized protein n=1 Tax=Caerostris extrusa TaxID=172846 RepID=A0AAV4V0G3_CAEEX|nr:uncharacterized protein CEXT_516711 [Caerostris extrusa]
MINSATKQNFKPQEVERMFSTPISTARFKKELEKSISGKKIARALFPPDDNPGKRQKHVLSPAKSPVVFSDSVILLQEIFQKLSQECKELLQPDVSSAVSQDAKASDKYVNNLVKNLRSKEISEGDFANIIGGIAQNIFLEAKLKNKSSFVTQAKSLPDLTKGTASTDPKLKTVSSWEDMTSLSNKVEEACNTASDSGFRDDTVELTKENSCLVGGSLGDRHLPDGWSKTPTTVSDASNQSTTENQRVKKKIPEVLNLKCSCWRKSLGLEWDFLLLAKWRRQRHCTHLRQSRPVNSNPRMFSAAKCDKERRFCAGSLCERLHIQTVPFKRAAHFQCQG